MHTIAASSEAVSYPTVDSSGEKRPILSGTYTLVNLCHGDQYFLPDGTLTSEPGIYLISNGTADPDTIELHVFPETPPITTTLSICEGDPLPTCNLKAHTDENGCIFLETIILTITPRPSLTTSTETICMGETIEWNGMELTDSGFYQFSVAHPECGDVIIETLELTVVVNNTFCTTSTDEATLNTLTVIPNPASNFIRLKGLNLNGITTAVLYNLNGQRVKRLQISANNPEISVEDLEAGLYFIDIIQAGAVMGQLKFVKTK